MSERCSWCGDDPFYVAYHDEEWGVPEFDSRALWEKLVLDGFQAGLSWITILRKRENFRKVFKGFDPVVLAGWGEAEVGQALADPGIVRHRGKIEATIGNAKAWIALEEAGGFDQFVWRYMNGKPLQNNWVSMAQVPAKTDLSQAMSKDLKAAGFKFCGPTIVYAWMQACGLVNDHMTGCPRHSEVAEIGQRPR